MKANAPEKIYIGIVPSDLGNLKYITVDKEFPDAVEYTRTDVFTEKVCEWLSDTLQTIEDDKKEELAQEYVNHTYKRYNIDADSIGGKLIYYAFMHGMNQC